jgi:HAD superfamily hydrolase (TIGR01509 family)
MTIEMKRIRGVIFDMDGLMVDSEPVQLRAVNDALRPLGISVSEADFMDMVGRRAIDNFRELKRRYGFGESPGQVEERKDRAYLKRVRGELKPMPGLFRVIEMCEAKGLLLALASSSPLKDIRGTLEILGLENRFSFIVSGDDVKRGKPDPEIFLKAAERCGQPPSSLLVLEDSGHGVNAASAAGMYVIAVPNRFTTGQDFSRADRVLSSLTEFAI